MQVALHSRGWGREIQKRVWYRPVFRTYVDGYEVEFSVVPNPTDRGNLGEDIPGRIGEVAVMGPSRGGYPKAEHLLHFLLLQEGYGGV